MCCVARVALSVPFSFHACIVPEHCPSILPTMQEIGLPVPLWAICQEMPTAVRDWKWLRHILCVSRGILPVPMALTIESGGISKTSSGK